MHFKVYLVFIVSSLWTCSCRLIFDKTPPPTPNPDFVYQTLTGFGVASGKTWRPIAGHGNMGIGDKNSRTPNISIFPEEVTTKLSAWNMGVLQNSYTFVQVGNRFIPKNKKTTTTGSYAQAYFGITQNTAEDVMVSDDHLKEACFKLRNENTGIGTGYTLEITEGCYMGRFDTRSKYQILSISPDTLKLRHLFLNTTAESQDTCAWYSTYVSNQVGDPSVKMNFVHSLLTDDNNPSGKTWRPISFGLGMSSTYMQKADFYNFDNGQSYAAWVQGTFKNKYKFIGLGNKFIPKNQQTTTTASYALRHFGIDNGNLDVSVTDPKLKETKFKLVNEKNGIGTGYTLEITDGAYMGRFDNTFKYYIMHISKDTLKLMSLFKNPDSNETLYAWHSTYVNNDGWESSYVSTDPIHQLLTHTSSTSGKTWRQANYPLRVGLGRAATLVPDYYDFSEIPAQPYWTKGTLRNKFTFVGLSNKFIPTNQAATVHWAYANKFFGIRTFQYEDVAVNDPKLTSANFILRYERTGIGTGYTLEITGNSYMGRFDNRRKYQIMSISADTLKLRHLFSDDPAADPQSDDLAWYCTYVWDKP